MEITTPDGVTLCYDDSGSGEPAIVFVHGWCCNRRDWRYQVPHFAKDHRVIALDQRGHGDSDKPDQDYGVAGFVDDLAFVVRELGLERPVIVGHSMGGVIAIHFARIHADLTRGIIAVDAPATPLPDALQPAASASIEALKTPAFASVAEGFVRTFMFNADSPPELVDETICGMAVAPQRLMHTALSDILTPGSTPAGEIPVPALYIRAATNYAPEGTQTEYFSGMDCDHVDAAHFLQLEKPNETNAIIERFLAKVTPGAAA
ncbi:MAG TPA: alpha/beta hydrolase [Dehalococcoidia bacterium]|nr:alpha/beta hydrolase [Dehalococcoidia bacterium]